MQCRVALTLLLIFLPGMPGVVAQKITWNQHIAPIIHANCSPCHKKGDAAPFELITYEDVAKRATFIKQVTQSRYMPPWKADAHYVNFANERKLSDEEIAMIATWADSKMPKGEEPAKDQELHIQQGTHYYRAPDTVLKMNKPFLIKGDNKERFIVYKIPYELPADMNVEAIEFISSNRQVIHHANYEIDAVPDLDIYGGDDYINLTEDDRGRYAQYVPFRKQMIYYGGWIPGATCESYPKNIGWIMPKRGVILLTLHYAPLGKEEENVSGIQLFFTKTPVKREIRAVSFGSGGVGEKNIDPYFYIPAGAVKTFRLKVTVPEDQSVMYVWPHMHYIGKTFKAFGVTPLGDTVKMVSVTDWNYKWQEVYWYKKLLKLPKGTVIHIEATYDNTAANPANPSSPPRLIYSSGDMKSTDEMLTLVMLYLPYEKEDETVSLKSESRLK
jgi:cytochrome c553